MEQETNVMEICQTDGRNEVKASDKSRQLASMLRDTKSKKGVLSRAKFTYCIESHISYWSMEDFW